MVHLLSNTYYFYYMPKRPKTMNDYLAGLQCISGPIKTVEDFWSYYSHMIRPVDEFSQLSDIYFFKEGIKPIWEDAENRDGGKFVVKTRRNYTSKWWEDLLLAFIGEQVDDVENINGIVISFRANDNNLIGIWNKNSEDNEKLLVSLKHLFKIDKLDYKPHFGRILKEEVFQNNKNENNSNSGSMGSSGLLSDSGNVSLDAPSPDTFDFMKPSSLNSISSPTNTPFQPYLPFGQPSSSSSSSSSSQPSQPHSFFSFNNLDFNITKQN
ncbi:hypothetical protein DICPUDRAFT_25523 [Dictyostelium purpureum]|uniref:Uncharacterized protein n=1 Tax=Dictyostelium purpureum TaxID=5786 RepID=F0Z779_DICPU|nr:uncharacterized protein DICPUDRAFT_25523 [Dictyostelium purpureum]EGC40198.1 hypothetical protein DICPUDRAFT_25523 [Dictyostelium purpureum]|eukprot:XP_003283267.1 hypothetical protein DICPUDRAFT_25523 [Dictyostelium purpureum]